MKIYSLKNSINHLLLISLFNVLILPSKANELKENNLKISSISELENKINQNIPDNYLKKIPRNDYIVGPGDVLRVSISRKIPELFTITAIDGEGTIYLPKIDRIFVKGLSLKELNLLLKKEYTKFVKNPSPEVEVEKYRTINVSVNGEVLNPGIQTLGGSINVPINTELTEETNQLEMLSKLQGSNSTIKSGAGISSNTLMQLNGSNIKNSLFPKNKLNKINIRKTANLYFPTVIDVIRSSGGFTEYSNLSKVELIRINNLSEGGGKIKTNLDFSSLLRNFNNDQNIRVYDGDIINIKKSNQPNSNILNRSVQARINSKFINVYVAGRVNNPGVKKIFRGSTANDAILIAGGPKIIKGPVRLLSFRNNGSIEKRKFRFSLRNKRGGYKNPFLQEGDLIAIGESPLSVTSEVIREVTSPLTGIFSTYGLIKALSD